MYIPGNDDRKLAKIPTLKADCICLDCEDGVAFTAKDKARENIRTLLETKTQKYFGQSECSLRINSVQSGLCHIDLEKIMGKPGGKTENFFIPSSINLPKVDNCEILDEFAYCFNGATADWLNPRSNIRVGLIIFIESAQGLMDLRHICHKAATLKQKSALVPEAIVFGSDDYVADIGAVRTESSQELLYARQKIVTHAKAFGLQAIDLVHIQYKDLEGLSKQSIEGANMGFTGKQVIHPSNIPVVHKAFSPSEHQIEWATQLITEFREHEKTGKGAFTFRGNMIDMPLVKQANNILIMSEKINSKH